MNRLVSGLLTTLACAGSAAGAVTFSGTLQNANPLLPPGSGRCAPTYFNTIVIGNGNGSATGASDRGAFTFDKSHCIVTAPPTALRDGQGTLDFSGGNTLSFIYDGNVTASGTPGVFNAVENWTFTGGTGRFLSATGAVTTTGTLRFANGVGNYAGSFAGSLIAPGVPEPAAWAMMIAGFGMVGAATRRRSRPIVAA